jgi:hypothetical protein
MVCHLGTIMLQLISTGKSPGYNLGMGTADSRQQKNNHQGKAQVSMAT